MGGQVETEEMEEMEDIGECCPRFPPFPPCPRFRPDHNGSAVVDYVIVSVNLLREVGYFSVGGQHGYQTTALYYSKLKLCRIYPKNRKFILISQFLSNYLFYMKNDHYIQ